MSQRSRTLKNKKVSDSVLRSSGDPSVPQTTIISKSKSHNQNDDFEKGILSKKSKLEDNPIVKTPSNEDLKVSQEKGNCLLFETDPNFQEKQSDDSSSSETQKKQSKKEKSEENSSPEEEGEEEEEEALVDINWKETLPQTIESLKDPKGGTKTAIIRYLCGKFGVHIGLMPMNEIKVALSQLVKDDILEQVNSQRWKLGPKYVSEKSMVKTNNSILHVPLDQREEQEFWQLYGLPPDMFGEIFSYLKPIPDLINCFQASKGLQRLASNPILWKDIDFSPYPHVPRESIIRFIKSFGPFIQSFNTSSCSNFDFEALSTLNEHAIHLRHLNCSIKLGALIWPELKTLSNKVLYPPVYLYYDSSVFFTHSFPSLKRLELGNIGRDSIPKFAKLELDELVCHKVSFSRDRGGYPEKLLPLKVLAVGGKYKAFLSVTDLSTLTHLEIYEPLNKNNTPFNEKILKNCESLTQLAMRVPSTGREVKIRHSLLKRLTLYGRPDKTIHLKTPSLESLTLPPYNCHVQFNDMPQLRELNVCSPWGGIFERFPELRILRTPNVPRLSCLSNLRELYISPVNDYHSDLAYWETVKFHEQLPQLEILSLLCPVRVKLTLQASKTLKKLFISTSENSQFDIGDLPALNELYVMYSHIKFHANLPSLTHAKIRSSPQIILDEIGRVSPNLESLEWTNLEKEEEDSALAKWKMKWPKLKTLSIKNGTIDATLSKNIMTGSPQLQTFICENMKFSDPDAFSSLATHFAKSIESVSFFRSTITTTELITNANKIFHNITALVLGGLKEFQHHITDKVIYAIASSAPRLEKLFLQNTSVSQRPIQTLAAKSLRTLHSICNSPLSQTKCDELVENYPISIYRLGAREFKLEIEKRLFERSETLEMKGHWKLPVLNHWYNFKMPTEEMSKIQFFEKIKSFEGM